MAFRGEFGMYRPRCVGNQSSVSLCDFAKQLRLYFPNYPQVTIHNFEPISSNSLSSTKRRVIKYNKVYHTFDFSILMFSYFTNVR